MANSSTVVVALRYRDGVLIGADSQASDLEGRVRWLVRKVDRIGNHPLVFGFSGNTGTSDRVFRRLGEAQLRATTFERRDRLQARLDAILEPEYQAAAARNNPPQNVLPIGLHGLAVTWAEGGPGILEFELNGDTSWHEHFHAVGSGTPTAYAGFRVLGGRDLCNLHERTALLAAVRIIKNVITVDMWGVSEPIDFWRVDARGAYQYPAAEINAHTEAASEWERRERERLFDADAQ